MSRVYFHSEGGVAELEGTERFYAHNLITSLAVGVLRPDWNPNRLRELTDPGHYLAIVKPGSWAAAYATAFAVDDSYGPPLIRWRGYRISPLDIALNTALLLGNDEVRLLARLNGQCETHGYVEGPDRRWLGDLIGRGLSSGLYRGGVGWERVAELLWSTLNGPVVMSYSVCGPFPNPAVADWQQPATLDGNGDEDWDAWDGLPADEQWQLGMVGLRTAGGLRLQPEGFARFRFGAGLTALDLVAPNSDTRLACALEDAANPGPAR